ncbi:MAG: T9SS type A sorting domain-containing protein [Verrucomicrobiota bacterium]|nr:T9SS type A sorting domain-containing protein [Verrucomicrobiota bacterium]
MKNLLRNALFTAVLAMASLAYGAAPINVTVSNPSGKVVARMQTDSKGAFGTGTLPAGQYIIQLNSKDSSMRGAHYTIVVSAGKKKVSAESIAGEKLAGAGVAMKIDVGAGMKLAGQAVQAEAGGKPGMVWIGPHAGSNMRGHWVPKGSPEAIEAQTGGRMNTEDVQKITDKAYNPQGG